MRYLPLWILTSILTLTACHQLPVEKQVMQPLNMVAQKIDNDSDQDGVLDDKDQCSDTPYNVVVDEIGCPVQAVSDSLSPYHIEVRIYYATNKAFPSHRYLEDEIKKIGEQLKEYPNLFITIESHASKADNNPKLISRERAEILAQILKEEYGINDKRIVIKSYGSERPVADNKTKKGQQMNQRIYAIMY